MHCTIAHLLTFTRILVKLGGGSKQENKNRYREQYYLSFINGVGNYTGKSPGH